MNIGLPKKIAAVSRPVALGKVALIALLSRTQVFGICPFGIAYAAAVFEENPFAAVVGLALGMAGKEPRIIAKYTLCALIYATIVYLRKFIDSSVRAVTLGFSVIAAAVFTFFGANATAASLILILPEAFAAGGLYKLFSNRDGDGISGFFAQIMLIGGCLGGIYGIKLPYIDASAAVLAASLFTMIICYSCEIPISVFAGAVLGFMLTVESPRAIEMTGIFAVSAMFSAMLSEMGRMGTAAGFLCGMTVSILFIGNLAGLSVTDIFVPPLIFIFLPETLIVRIGSGLNKAIINSRYGTQGEQISKTLKTVAKAVNDLGDGVRMFSGSGYGDCCSDAIERLCGDCGYRTSCFGKNFEEANEKFSALFEVMEREGSLSYKNLPKNFDCRRTERFLDGFSHIYELKKQSAVYSSEAGADRNIIAKQYGEISNIINAISDGVITAQREPEETERQFTVSVSVCAEPKKGQEVSGDTVLHFGTGNKYFVILCDGMGSGKAAREISGLTARLFAEFLNAGIDKGSAMNMINSALALNADRESFSSVDLLEIDTLTGRAEFLKTGSAQSFIKTERGTEEISSDALPIGILDGISVTPKKYTLSAGDVVLMVSDGITEAGNGIMKSEWIKKLPPPHKNEDEAFARQLVSGAKIKTVYSDDMTSVVIRLEKAEGRV